MIDAPYGTAIDIKAGQEFNYAVWNANTKLSFHNVPWNSDYRDLVNYPTQAALDAYLDTVQGPVFNTTSYSKANEPVRVNLPFNKCYKHNYLRVYNPAEPLGTGVDEARVFYYFIKDVRFLAPNTTELVIQLDVWQTFSRYIQFGNSYIERGHIGIANENAFDDHGRTFLTVPEGLDCGNEFVTVYANEYTIADTSNYSVLVAATTDLGAAPGTKEDPYLGTANGSNFEGLPNGMSLWLFENHEKFTMAMARFASYPWVTQGIISIMLVPPIYATMKAITLNQEKMIPIDDEAPQPAVKMIGGEIPGTTVTTANMREHLELPDRYAHLSKFKTFPYSAIEMTTYHGAPLLLKPECVATDALYTRIAMHVAPPNPRIVVYPLKYNGKRYETDAAALLDVHDDNQPMLNDRSEFMDFMTGIFDLPMFSIVNNAYLSYMASNRNSIAYAYQSADWTQQRAMTGVQLGYNQSNAGMAQALGQSMNNNQGMVQGANLLGGLARARGGMNAIASVTSGAVAATGRGVGALATGMIGATQDMVSGELDYAQQMGMAGIQSTNNTANMLLNQQTSAYMRDTNQDYGNFAAKGDYQNEIAAINARVQDAKLLQPTTSGQMGGEAFNLAAFKWGVFYKYKMLQPAVMASIGELWLRYGYAINRFGRMPANYSVMSKFTYWKLRESYITSSSCPEGFKQAIRGIFEKGVTVWTNPADIGNIDIADNQPLEGVTL